MSPFHEISPADLLCRPFSLIGEDWLLVTVAAAGRTNTMTASWGGLGVIWGKSAATIYLRPQRYTKELLDQSETFSLSVLGAPFRQTLSYLGAVSGREEDKIKKAGLTLWGERDTPYFAEASLVFLCRKLYGQPMAPENFSDESLSAAWYPQRDYHVLYIGAIERILQKEA